ncbi:BUB3-interacting and GLEBS motif-containing protein [Ditylenchus destructor]|nr:BUB3-interacting and GLEBS motif-containing protein [Ditylenchus destructor]
MGRKKKKSSKPWCWYCNREFEDEKILIQHQKAKHFKCHICGKKLFTGPGLSIHCMQVHKETIDKIPAALPGRDSVEIEVYGMEGIPPEDDRDGPPQAKLQKTMPTSSIPTPSIPQHAPPFGMMPFGGMPPMPGMMPHMPYGAFPPMPMSLPMRMPMMPAQIPMPRQMSTPMSVPLPSQAPPSTSIPTPRPPQPAAPTFPAYQGKNNSVETPNPPNPVDISSSSANAGLKSLGSKTRIVCPDENVSLEERMAVRFQNLGRNVHYLNR